MTAPGTFTAIGGVEDLWRFPVKSMRGEPLREASLDAQGVLGDRAYALVDVETGAVAGATDVRRFPGLLDCRADFLEPPRPGAEPPAVRVTLPDGTSATSDSGELEPLLSAYFRRDVTLARTVPDSYVVSQAAFFRRHGLEVTAPRGSFVDLCPLSIMTTATLGGLAAANPASRFDRRRFRMNVIVRADGDGFVENAWLHRRLTLGEVGIRVTSLDPRCAMTTLAQADLDRDPGILRAIAQGNSQAVGTASALPCAGVYASIETPGHLRVGERVCLAHP